MCNFAQFYYVYAPMEKTFPSFFSTKKITLIVFFKLTAIVECNNSITVNNVKQPLSTSTEVQVSHSYFGCSGACEQVYNVYPVVLTEIYSLPININL